MVKAMPGASAALPRADQIPSVDPELRLQMGGERIAGGLLLCN